MPLMKKLGVAFTGLAALVAAETAVLQTDITPNYRIVHAGEAQTEWKYARIGGEIPTHDELISHGYVCTNCDKPKIESFFIEMPELRTFTYIYRKDDSLIALRKLNGISYALIEGRLSNNSRIWCNAYLPNGIITSVSNEPTKFSIDLGKYLSK